MKSQKLHSHDIVNSSWKIFRLLADPTRVRILALLMKEELAVVELQEILDMAQSRISSQLSLMKQGQLVVDRRDGKKAFYSLNLEMSSASRRLVDSTCSAVKDFTELKEDALNLERVLQRRRDKQEKYFNMIAGRLGRHYCPGRSWEALGHLAMRLIPAIEIADLGAGEGLISQLLARRAARVWCIDKSPKMVEVGTRLAKENGLFNLEYRLGDIENVPLGDKSVDLAIFSQALHHALHPQAAINEAARILRPGGQVLILDLRSHNFEKARELYADVWLGFKESELHAFLKKAHFRGIEVSCVSKEMQEPYFEVLLASGIRE